MHTDAPAAPESETSVQIKATQYVVSLRTCVYRCTRGVGMCELVSDQLSSMAGLGRGSAWSQTAREDRALRGRIGLRQVQATASSALWMCAYGDVRFYIDLHSSSRAWRRRLQASHHLIGTHTCIQRLQESRPALGALAHTRCARVRTSSALVRLVRKCSEAHRFCRSYILLRRQVRNVPSMALSISWRWRYGWLDCTSTHHFRPSEIEGAA